MSSAHMSLHKKDGAPAQCAQQHQTSENEEEEEVLGLSCVIDQFLNIDRRDFYSLLYFVK